MDAFLSSPWFEKLFWLFFIGVVVFIAVIWIRMIVGMFRFSRPMPRGSARAKSSGGGFSESASAGMLGSAESSADSGSSDFSPDSASESSGGSDFSSGGGESGGGGATGGWS